MLLDFEDPSIESIRGLLLRCVIHPVFLKVAEGRRFLSALFSLSPSMPTLIVGVMKPQIGAGVKGVVSSYGEVLYRAWKDAESSAAADESSTKEMIEESLQGLVHDAIHAGERKYFRGLRLVLGAFNDQKRIKGVDAMLLKVYGPILWRSLRCANALVRAQATVLFFDAFPLQDSEASAVESDQVLQKQFDLLSSLLKDADHRVRAAAANGVCHILREYWEALPIQTTRQILSYVVGTLGNDTSCAHVRLAVVTGLGELLEQPLSHGVLGNLLPLLSNAIHDTSEKVRVAFIQVLCKVKGLKGMHFYDIVPVDHLLERLAEDADRPLVCSAMANLLLSSFYPQGDKSKPMGPEQMQRCLKFVRENVRAAVAFYGHFYKHTSVGSATKMCVMLFALLLQPAAGEAVVAPTDVEEDEKASCVSHPLVARAKRRREQEVAKRAGETRESADAASTSSSTLATGFDATLRVGVLRVLLSCLSSISDKLTLANHAPSRELLGKHFTDIAVPMVFERISSDVESLPLLLKVIALSNAILTTSGKFDEDDEESAPIPKPSGLNASTILASFAKAWTNISTDEELEHKAALLHQQAAAAVDVVCTLGETAALTTMIHSSFKVLESVVSETEVAGSKKKSSASALPLDAAVELMACLIEGNEQSVVNVREELLVDFGSEGDVLTMCFATARKAAEKMLWTNLITPSRDEVSSKTLVRSIHLNASYAMMKSSQIDVGAGKGKKSTSSTSEDATAECPSLVTIIEWVSDFVLPFVCSGDGNPGGPSTAKHTYSQQLLASVLCVFSDLIVFDSTPLDILVTIEHWATSLLRLFKAIHESEERAHSIKTLVPTIGRICCLLCNGKGRESTARNNALSLLLQCVLFHLGNAEAEGEGVGGATAIASLRVYSALLKSKQTQAVVEETVNHLLPLVAIVSKKNADGSQKRLGTLSWEAPYASQCYTLLKDNTSTSELGAKSFAQTLIRSVNNDKAAEARASCIVLADFATSCPDKVQPSIKTCVADVCNQILKKEEKENSNALTREVLAVLQATLA